MTKVISIVCYVVAGFFLYTIMLLSFISGEPLAAKFGIMGVFVVPATISLLIGLFLSGYSKWQRDVGIVFLSSALSSAFLVSTIFATFSNPDVMEQVPNADLSFFSDYTTGGLCILLFLCLGGLLYWQSRTKTTSSSNPESQPTTTAE